MRGYLIVANWKMNSGKERFTQLTTDISAGVSSINELVQVVLCPSAPYLDCVSGKLTGTKIQLGAQNCANTNTEAFTGEVSSLMLHDFGCSYVILGHSERRLMLAEDNSLIAAKFIQAKYQGIVPIVCVGESKDDFSSGRGFNYVEQQLEELIHGVGVSALHDSVIAYEPIWAIGTGLSANPEQVQSMHRAIRAKVAKFDANVAASLRIIYGGSLKVSNCKSLLALPEVDGALIGGASLVAPDFVEICQTAESMVI